MNKLTKISLFIKNNKYVDVLFLFSLTITIYVHNLSPGVYGGDSGDFLAAAITKGVPHPSAYPLYTLLGIVALKLPILATPAWKYGLVSSLFASLSVVLMYFSVLKLTKSRYLSIVTGLLLAFIYPFWLQAEIVEVFSLHTFFVLSLLYVTFGYIESKNPKYLYCFALFLGLSLANNMTIVLILPPLVVAIIAINWKILTNFRLLLQLILLGIVGLMPYIYIPLSIANNKFYSWGYAVNAKNFLSLILRKKYGWGVSTAGFSQNTITHLFGNYLIYLWEYVGITILSLIILGAFYLVVTKRYAHLFIISLTYFFVGPFFLFYSRNPINSFSTIAVFERFYLAGIVVLFLLIPLGVVLLTNSIAKIKLHSTLAKLLTLSIFVTFGFLPFALILSNYPRLNFENVFIGDNLASDILDNLPNGSVALLTGDTKVFNTYYLQYAYNRRKDIYIPGRPDSFIGLIRMAGLNEQQTEEYMRTRGGTIDLQTFTQAVPNLLQATNVYTDREPKNMELVHEKYGKVIFVPYGLVNKLYFEDSFDLSKNEYIQKMEDITSRYQIEEFFIHNNIIDYSINYTDIKHHYTLAYYSIAHFIATHYNDPEEAQNFIRKCKLCTL